MQKTILYFFTIGLLFFAPDALIAQTAEPEFRFTHGPYLQEVSETGVTILFSSSSPAFSWVQITDRSGKSKNYHDIRHGMKQANNTFNSIRIEGLTPATNYQYSIFSAQIKKFEPYSVVYGDTIQQGTFQFSTLNKNADKLTFIETSDIHGNNEKLEKLLMNAGVATADMVIYGGDMIDYFATEDQPFDGFLDKSVELFAKEKPLVYTRGNHETRGRYSRDLYRYFPRQDHRYYYCFRQGPAFFIILDSGEDKEDTHPVYAGLNNFDEYRQEQANWLKELIKSEEFKKSPVKIVVSHIPPLPNEKWHGPQHASEQWLPILNKAGIDLMLCGHTHKFAHLPAKSDLNKFPVIIGSNQTATRVEINRKNIDVKVFDSDNKEIDHIVINK